MSNYGMDDLVVEIDAIVDAGELTAITAYVTEVGGFEVEAIVEDSHTVGDSWIERLYTGLRNAPEFTLKGFYDDTTGTGPDVILDGIGEQRSFKFTWGGTKTSAFECIIQKYAQLPARGELTKFECTLAPTGQVVEV